MLINQICRVWMGTCYPTPDDDVLLDFNGNPYSEVYFEKTKEYYYSDVSCKDTKVELSTGKKDKNGKLIFEGDIIEIEYTDVKMLVTFEDSAFWLTYGYNKDPLFNYTSAELKIIGNVNENKELL